MILVKLISVTFILVLKYIAIFQQMNVLVSVLSASAFGFGR